MWYIDVTEGENTYRGVYFTSYRPYYTGSSSSADSSNQDNNGYFVSDEDNTNIYWFKFDPLKWRILAEEDGNALILCESIIDSQQYYRNYNSRTINNQTVYSSNYEYSGIRAWLNEVFYETAFSELQQGIINTVTVDNSARSTNPNNNALQWNSGVNAYACSDTQDKVFLLSEQEVTNSDYGFDSSSINNDTVRRKKATAYAQAQGAYTYNGGSYDGNGWWWLRSPHNYDSYLAREVNHYGCAGTERYVSATRSGVLPALQIRLGDVESEPEPEPEPEPATLYTRIDADGNEDANGDYILFGTYPQSEVTDDALKATLNAKAGTLPTAENAQAWTSYEYYIEGTVQDYMWYIDVTEGGETYRGVYFTSYRLYYIASYSYTYQDDNGYTTGNVYWFKYDPLKWRILSEENENALILCESLIDSQQYYHQEGKSTRTRTAVANYNDDYYAGNGSTVTGAVYDNNYQYSEIRAWLNEVFYETAFSKLQQGIINTVTVDNSARSTNPNNNATAFNSGTNTYACSNTQDKVFLLSEQEVTNSAYGFNSEYSNYDTVRRKQPTAYAQAQGAYTVSSGEYAGNGWWWLRSPSSGSSGGAGGVHDSGHSAHFYTVDPATRGVLPALQIRLD